MEQKDIQAVYFIGVGGIGMSALARYFLSRGLVVGGYDLTATVLTRQLEKEGALLHYTEDTDSIPFVCRDPQHCLVVYTPAVPDDMEELVFFRTRGFTVEKRAQVLGRLTEQQRGLCVAGTHGKTSTTAICAHIMHQGHLDCNAFLGGIAKNYGTNYIVAAKSDYVVVEADEYDRSFHCLRPYISVITNVDPDHLDIYGTEEAYRDSFRHYTSLIQRDGTLIIHRGLHLPIAVQEGVQVYEYGCDGGDFHAENIHLAGDTISFDFLSPIEDIAHVVLGQPIPINIPNGIAAMAMAQIAGCTADEIRYGMRTYRGVERRFDVRVANERHILLSDYAHHPQEIRQSIKSVQQMFPNRKITAIFQPHLYSRTRDFYQEFAAALSMLDEVVLCEIYPAREKPIAGVTSQLIYDHLAPTVAKSMIHSSDVLSLVRQRDFEVLLILGAGDLDNYTPQIEKIIKAK